MDRKLVEKMVARMGELKAVRSAGLLEVQMVDTKVSLLVVLWDTEMVLMMVETLDYSLDYSSAHKKEIRSAGYLVEPKVVMMEIRSADLKADSKVGLLGNLSAPMSAAMRVVMKAVNSETQLVGMMDGSLGVLLVVEWAGL